ncbi:UPF0182 family protein [Thermobifida halotolerans]|uniref:UPF0182 protein NI17_023455 n=1 Tax=Thermobifida halotolerans TaxID=483545 RepID=A0AA97M6I9_9ACTN|nr:UPF0182 family protein [Thermobifida halotolerans]UOE22225.1 UPF0182 family protein [Thermobifida halotolerans]
MPRRSRLLAPVGAAVVVIIAGIMFAANFWTEYKWFASVDYTTVFWTELRTRSLLFVAGALLMALAVGLSVYFAYRTRPAYRPFSLEQQGLDRYRSSIDPHRRIFFWGLVGGLALLTGASATAEWQTFLQFTNATDFGTEDAQFGLDISFYTFVYPFLQVILGYLYTAVVIAFIAGVVVHYLYGGVRLQSQSQRVTPAARVHLSILLGIFVLLRAADYWLEQYGLVFSTRGYTFGASYTDVNAVLYAKIILFIIALVCAVLFFANIYFKNAMVPLVSLGLLILSAVLIGGVYPAIVQQITVSPNEQRLENPYIQRNIEATRAAYGVDSAEVTDYDAQTQLTTSELAAEAETIPSVRLVDPAVVSQTFQQLQQVRGFYQFPEVLEVDRYTTGEDETVDTIVAVRELDGPPAQEDRWLTRHLVYTHGFGMVAAAGNQVDSEGRPVFLEYNIPPTGELSDNGDGYQPRVYFGREGAEYVIVNAEAEYDYPVDSDAPEVPTAEDAVTSTPSPSPEADEAQAPAGQQEEAPAEEQPADSEEPGSDSGQANNYYDGDGGVQLSNFFDKLMYAVKYQEVNILLNSAINDESQIIYVRDPAERVEKVAPFLTVDGKAYPAVVDGKIVWIVDAYTTSDQYPYSTPIDLAQATTDTFTESTTAVNALPGNQVNYIRNSVKATVDAYDGTVTLYGWDEEDPVLQTWSKAFPDVVTSKEEISDTLLSHLRYPDDLYKVQREILERYHVTNADAFYGGQDFWTVPNDPKPQAGENPEPPYRQTIRFPGDEAAMYSLTSTFVPRGRENLAAFMAVNSDAASDSYGQMRILELPRSTAVQGPGQIQNTFQSSAEVREVLLPLEQSSAQVTYGNLLTLPFAGGLLYVEPLYVQAGGSDASYPLLQQVLVGFGDQVAIGGNLQEALNNLFDDGEAPLEEPVTEEDGGGETDGGQAPAGGDLAQALEDAAEAYEDGQAALREGDFAAYGEANERLEDALERAEAASGNSGGE